MPFSVYIFSDLITFGRQDNSLQFFKVTQQHYQSLFHIFLAKGLFQFYDIRQPAGPEQRQVGIYFSESQMVFLIKELVETNSQFNFFEVKL